MRDGNIKFLDPSKNGEQVLLNKIVDVCEQVKYEDRSMSLAMNNLMHICSLMHIGSLMQNTLILQIYNFVYY